MAVLSLQVRRNFLLAFSTVVVLCFLCAPSTHSAQVTLAWDPNTEPTIAGYKVHYGTLSGNYQTHLDAGLNTTYLVTNLPDGGTYYFAVTAYDSSATESGYSAEVSYSASAACTYAISPASQSISSSGGAGTVSITAPAGCVWTAVSNSSWAILTSNSSGSANGTVNYSVSANPATASRSGTMTIAGKTFTLNEAGLSCSYAISPAGQTFDSNGGSGSLAVTALSGCAWNAALMPESGLSTYIVCRSGSS